MTNRTFGRPFYPVGQAYLHAANVLFEQSGEKHLGYGADGLALPIQFLYSHAAELLLKAFLRLNGLAVDELAARPYGHNLVALYDACNTRGLGLSAADGPAIRMLLGQLAEGHGDYQFRYFEKSLGTAEVSWIRDEVGKLAEAVRSHIDADQQAFEQEAKARNHVLVDVADKLIFTVGRPESR